MKTLWWMRKQGFRPVPLWPQQKAAINRDYVSLTYKAPDDDFWRVNNYGVGCVTGPAHGGPLDGDLDCQEALFFAPRFFPPTDAVFGRVSKPRSHLIYKVDAPSFEKIAFVDPISKETIIELRGDDGHQTVFPGSLHEDTGELITWSDTQSPDVPTVKADDLRKAARMVALATMISRYIWAPGYHNEPTKHLAGLFYYLEWAVEDVEQIIQAVMDYHDDKDKSRIPTIRATYRRGEAGKKVSGSGVLRKQIKNDTLVDKILEWAGSPSVNLVTEYNEKFAVVSLRGKFRIADTSSPPSEPPVFFQKDDWMNMFSTDYSGQVTDKGIPIPKTKLWLNNPRRRSYRAADFMPGVEEAGDVLNLWTGWAIEPKKGTCNAWMELLELICNGDQVLVTWILHWFANIVREPRNKSQTALALVGEEGAGKSLLIRYFGRILGSAYVVVTNDDHIFGKFNQHLGSALLLHSEEALYGGDKKHAGIIRSLITDETRMFEQKGIDAIQVKNFLRMALTSNKIHVAPVASGDRRYTVVDMQKRLISEQLMNRVLDELNADGPAALFQFLLDMDYNPKLARVNVKNEGLRTVKEHNMEPVDQWWYNALSVGCIFPDYLAWAAKPDGDDWPHTVSSKGLYVSMQIEFKERGHRSIPSEAMLAYYMERFIGIKLMRAQRSYDNPLIEDAPQVVKQLSARQNSIINMPTLDVCRAAFERYLGQKVEWPAADDTVKKKRSVTDVKY